MKKSSSERRRLLPVVVSAPPSFRPSARVPETRGDCPKKRPCVHVRCIHHLWRVDAQDRAGRPWPGGRRPGTQVRATGADSCALDVAERMHGRDADGVLGFRQLGPFVGLGYERAKQITEGAMAKMRLTLELLVAKCEECPCAEAGRCMHPALTEERGVDGGAPPPWCPLRRGSLVTVTRLGSTVPGERLAGQR